MRRVACRGGSCRPTVLEQARRGVWRPKRRSRRCAPRSVRAAAARSRSARAAIGVISTAARPAPQRPDGTCAAGLVGGIDAAPRGGWTTGTGSESGVADDATSDESLRPTAIAWGIPLPRASPHRSRSLHVLSHRARRRRSCSASARVQRRRRMHRRASDGFLARELGRRSVAACAAASAASFASLHADEPRRGVLHRCGDGSDRSDA